MSLKPNDDVIRGCQGPELSHCRKVVFAVFSLTILLLLIYSNSFDCAWQFDDEPNITDNPNIHLEEISWKGIKNAIFSNRNTPDFPYRPVACLTFALNYYFGGKNVFGYHLVNLTIHWLASIFLFLFIYHTLNLPKLKSKYGANSYALALLAAVFWAINPVQVQAVTYIVQRMASLAGLFFILSMYLYLKARTSVGTKQANVFFGLCFLSFLMAIGSKENAAMLPVVIFIYETLLIQKDSTSFLKNNLTLILTVVACTLILGMGYLYFKGGNIFSFLNSYDTTRPFTLGQRLLTEPRVILFYISLLIYPLTDRLNIAHSIDLSTSLIDPPFTLFAITVILILISGALYISKRNPLVSFCILFFFINHLIESTIFPLELVYEHRNYIPSMFFFLPLALGIFAFIKYYQTKILMKGTLTVFFSLIMVGFGHAAHLRNLDWKTPRTLWADALDKSPDIFRPYHNLAKVYQKQGRLDTALELYQEGLKKHANNRKNEKYITYYNLGNLFKNMNNNKKAKIYFQKAINMKPSYGPAYNNMAALYQNEGKDELAFEYAIKAFEKWPGDPVINLNLGFQYLKRSEFTRAKAHLQRTLASKESRKQGLLYLAIVYQNIGLSGRASVLYQDALRENPRDIKVRLHLAELYQKTGHYERAERETQKALRLIHSTQAFRNILDKITKIDFFKNVTPDAEIIIPLLQKACIKKADNFAEWNMILEDYKKLRKKSPDKAKAEENTPGL